jgi:hypothetical protein
VEERRFSAASAAENERGFIAPAEFFMSLNHKKSLAGTIVLILFGILALLGGVKWLALLIPGATLIWYTARTRLGRN